MSGGVRKLVPRPMRRLAAQLVAEAVGAGVRSRVRRLVRSDNLVIAGPWLGEVGFELLYWIPFLRWVVETEGLDPKRIIVVSRGGPKSWYRGLGTRYLDVFDYLNPDDFRRRNEVRRRELGEQKQLRLTILEREIIERIRRDLDDREIEVLHPSQMYQVMQPYWWHHTTASWVERHTRYALLAGLSEAPQLKLPESYVAVKFYFNDCFTATPANRTFITSTLRTLTEHNSVVSLSTGLELDDHGESDLSAMSHVLTGEQAMTPRNNLALQTEVVARANVFIGTYGGFAYLAPFLGVPTTAVWSDQRGFNVRHLELIQRALGHVNGAPLDVTEANQGMVSIPRPARVIG